MLRFFLVTILCHNINYPDSWPGDYFVEEEACGALSECQMVDDSMLTIFLLFIFPSELSLWTFTSEAESRVAPSLMDWQFVQQRFPFWTWAIVVVIYIIIRDLI